MIINKYPTPLVQLEIRNLLVEQVSTYKHLGSATKEECVHLLQSGAESKLPEVRRKERCELAKKSSTTEVICVFDIVRIGGLELDKYG